MAGDNEIGAPKPGEHPTRDQLKELLLRVLDGMIEEKEQGERPASEEKPE